MKPAFAVLLLTSIFFQTCRFNKRQENKIGSTAIDTVGSITLDSLQVVPDNKPDSVAERLTPYPGNTFPPKFIIYNDTVNVLKQVFVIKADGIDAYPNPGINRGLKHYDYGEIFNVIADSAGWYISENNLDKLYVKKTDVVEETEIPLTDDSLNVAYENDSLGTPKHYPNIQIKLVSREQFYNMKKTAINYFNADTQSIRKVNGKFSLKFKNKTKNFIDDGNAENDYVGQIPALNAYVIEIGSDEAERSLFYLFDKRTGKMQYRFPTMPYMSIDKKFFISIDELDEDNSDVYVYVNKKGINYDYAFGRYKNWIAADTTERFWGNDGCFYLPVLPKMAYRNRLTNPMRLPATYNFRYVRIKITGPSPPILQ